MKWTYGEANEYFLILGENKHQKSDVLYFMEEDDEFMIKNQQFVVFIRINLYNYVYYILDSITICISMLLFDKTKENTRKPTFFYNSWFFPKNNSDISKNRDFLLINEFLFLFSFFIHNPFLSPFSLFDPNLIF